MKLPLKQLTPNDYLPWATIDERLSEAKQITGGFSKAFKGTLRLNNGQEVFVKLAANDAKSQCYVEHEINAYNFLARNGYKYMARVLSVAPDKKGFAIEVLGQDNGWTWPSQWTKPCLEDVLSAMDSLNHIRPINESGDLFIGVRQVDENRKGWATLGSSPEMQERLEYRLRGRVSNGLVTLNFIKKMIHKEAKFKFKKDTLVHNDIRSYNCTWHEKYGAKLIDFDSLGLGDSRIFYAFTLGDACGDGVDIDPYYKAKTDISSLEWVAGYWLAESFRENLNPEDRENKIRRAAAVIEFCKNKSGFIKV